MATLVACQETWNQAKFSRRRLNGGDVARTHRQMGGSPFSRPFVRIFPMSVREEDESHLPTLAGVMPAADGGAAPLPSGAHH
jgi:hypothetical protein